MNEAEMLFKDMEMISTAIQLDLLKGELKWEDDVVQFFIPVALNFTDFDWLGLIAENNLIEEDAAIVKNFLAMAKSLKEVNESRLNESISDKIGRLLK